MKLTIRYFAALREALGTSETLEIADGATVADVRAALVARGGRHAELLAGNRPVRCALNQAMAPETTPVADGAEIAFFPPVTGG
ncbi:MAG: molybdopterin converting factor subunit 1 [Burkholderiaceae bacterium]|nr:molybdopterin converting factor subunit 1 [Caldilineaceae bacterium]MCB1996174.1 molybdopterin converting factor subunit 1 [Rhodoferax sp.]MCP5270271.1 molybdopterin converting factor subunit 1 [Burkholderiaceae bacterium]